MLSKKEYRHDNSSFQIENEIILTYSTFMGV